MTDYPAVAARLQAEAERLRAESELLRDEAARIAAIDRQLRARAA